MSLAASESSVFSARPDELYLFQIENGPTYRYTAMRLPVMVSGFEYTPKAIKRGNYTFKKDVTSEDSLQIEVQADLPLLDHFKIIVPVRKTKLTLMRRHRGDEDQEIVTIWRGRVRGVTWEGAKATIECDSSSTMAKRAGLTLNYQVPCNYMVFSVGCGLAKGDWGLNGTIERILSDGQKLRSGVFATKPDGWWRLGWIEVGGGAYMITAHSGDTITLLHAVEGIDQGEEFFVYPGCDQRQDTCWDKFGNGLNHLGFNWSPADNVFETGI